MKLLLTLMLIIGIAGSAQADTAWFYDENRSGEGIVLTEFKDRAVFSFYTFVSGSNLIPPVVSPMPPGAKYCEMGTIWFIGDGALEEGVAYGDIYYQVIGDLYPSAIDGEVSTSVIVGDFVLTQTKTGWDLWMEQNTLLCNMDIFGKLFTFDTLLTK